MYLIVFRCFEKTGCGKSFGITTEDFEHNGFSGVYICPVCGGFKVKTIFGPTEIERPHIKIKAGGKDNTNTTLDEQAQQGPDILIRQLRGAGRRDNKLGEGTPKEQEQPIIDGVVQPRPDTSEVRAILEEYEEECSRYLGVQPDPRYIF